MTSALVISSSAVGAPALAADLEAVGVHVLGAVARSNMVRETIREAPDVIVLFEARADEGLFAELSLLAGTAPRPVIVFTNDGEVEHIERAMAAGVQAYVVNGYGMHRLRALIQIAQLRFAREQKLRTELDEVTRRFEERKLVDRAKGILMRARQMSEEDAFRVLRTASMHSKLRVGQVSQQVIDAAHYGEAVNRAGQLRMLSQRLVKAAVLLALGVQPKDSAALLATSRAHVDANLALLSRTLSKPTFGDLLAGVVAPWTRLNAMLEKPAGGAARLREIDALAEELLARADQLTLNLETHAMTTSLHVINAAGRQRMLSQRLAKQALLGVHLAGDAATAMQADASTTRAAFEQALEYLATAPLSTSEIRASLADARIAWNEMTHAIDTLDTPGGQTRLAIASESLLALFDRLTGEYERSMQLLMG